MRRRGRPWESSYGHSQVGVPLLEDEGRLNASIMVELVLQGDQRREEEACKYLENLRRKLRSRFIIASYGSKKRIVVSQGYGGSLDEV
ncbi:hypothetical protein CR513_12559, partial [Mucuna pruriens]